VKSEIIIRGNNRKIQKPGFQVLRNDHNLPIILNFMFKSHLLLVHKFFLLVLFQLARLVLWAISVNEVISPRLQLYPVFHKLLAPVNEGFSYQGHPIVALDLVNRGPTVPPVCTVPYCTLVYCSLLNVVGHYCTLFKSIAIYSEHRVWRIKNNILLNVCFHFCRCCLKNP
jgi:hypothetical protein